MTAAATARARLRQALLGWIYPPTCAVCDLPLDSARQLAKPFLCEACEATLVPIGDLYCTVCGQGYDGVPGVIYRCGNCGDRDLAIDFAVSAYRGAGAGRGLVHRLKFGRQRHLARLCGVLMGEVWRDARLHEGPWWVVPVPLHPSRRRERGFNQSEELARELIRGAPEGIGLEWQPILRRLRQTERQARLDRKERLANLGGVFAAARGRLPSAPAGGARILLVDDVITTGTTVSECAAALRDRLEIDRIAAVSLLRG